MNKIIVYLKNFDWILLGVVILLICFGLVELYSIALSQQMTSSVNFKKQIFFVILGLIVMFILAFFDYYNWYSFSYYFYLAGSLLLLGVLFFGHTVRGTTGWYEFGGLSLQPVEFAKFVLIIFLSRYFSGNIVNLKPLKHFILSGLGVGLFIILVLKQPDFGSALILFFLWVVMLGISGIKKRYLVIVGLISLLAFFIGWFFFFKDYQKERIKTFFAPERYSLNQGYNIRQAIIAVGAGRLWGRGVGFGSQSQLKFLPEAQNDFIFAVVAEELGLLGVSLVLGFFAIMFYRLLIATRKVNNDFGIYFLIGTAALIFIEMFINIGMNIGILPVVGISLPFLSYGGSAIISTLMLIGVAESIIIRSKLKF
jgi:rod shape determining protein RodA